MTTAAKSLFVFGMPTSLVLFAAIDLVGAVWTAIALRQATTITSAETAGTRHPG